MMDGGTAYRGPYPIRSHRTLAEMDARQSPHRDLGPTTPRRIDVYLQARALRALADMACDLTSEGPHCDVTRALRKLNEMRVLLGPDEF